jgi:phage tail protein X
MARDTLEVNQDHMSLDLVLWRRFGVELPGRVERSLELNQDLARLGPYLPVGTRVEIELPAPIDKASPVKVLRLWG